MWTDDRVEKLRKWWAEGLTGSEIAERLGGVSRNAVLGKAHRLGLEKRPNPIILGMSDEERRRRRRERDRNRRGGRRRSVRAVVHSDKKWTPPPPRRQTFSPWRVCQYIAGEPTEDDSCKCLEPTLPGHSWCREHFVLTHRRREDV